MKNKLSIDLNKLYMGLFFDEWEKLKSFKNQGLVMTQGTEADD